MSLLVSGRCCGCTTGRGRGANAGDRKIPTLRGSGFLQMWRGNGRMMARNLLSPSVLDGPRCARKGMSMAGEIR